MNKKQKKRRRPKKKVQLGPPRRAYFEVDETDFKNYRNANWIFKVLFLINIINLPLIHNQKVFHGIALWVAIAFTVNTIVLFIWERINPINAQYFCGIIQVQLAFFTMYIAMGQDLFITSFEAKKYFILAYVVTQVMPVLINLLIRKNDIIYLNNLTKNRFVDKAMFGDIIIGVVITYVMIIIAKSFDSISFLEAILYYRRNHHGGRYYTSPSLVAVMVSAAAGWISSKIIEKYVFITKAAVKRFKDRKKEVKFNL